MASCPAGAGSLVNHEAPVALPPAATACVPSRIDLRDRSLSANFCSDPRQTPFQERRGPALAARRQSSKHRRVLAEDPSRRAQQTISPESRRDRFRPQAAARPRVAAPLVVPQSSSRVSVRIDREAAACGHRQPRRSRQPQYPSEQEGRCRPGLHKRRACRQTRDQADRDAALDRIGLGSVRTRTTGTSPKHRPEARTREEQSRRRGYAPAARERGDRADVARRSGDSPCRTAAYATGRDAQTRWLFWWSSRRLNAALVPSNETSAFVPKRACRLARCTRSDCRRRAAAWWRLEALVERGGVDRGAGWVWPADARVGSYRLSSGAGRGSGRSLAGDKHA